MSRAKATALLNDATLMEALDNIEQRAIEETLGADFADDERRNFGAIKANTVRAIRRELKRMCAEDNPSIRRA